MHISRVRASLRRRWTRLRKRFGPEVLYTYSFGQSATVDPRDDWVGYSLVPVSAENLAEFRSSYPDQQNDRKHGIMTARINHPVESSWLIRGPGGTWCGYCHIAWQDVDNARIGHRVKVTPSQAYFFDDYVVGVHRGKRLQAFSIAARLELAARRGAVEGLTTISKGNAPSLVSYAKFGLVRTGTLLAFPRWKRTVAIPAPSLLVRTGADGR